MTNVSRGNATANVELASGWAPVDRVELGGWLGLQATGLEIRAQPLSQRDGAPLSAASSVGALTPSLIGPDGVGVRFGTDLGLRVRTLELLLGGYGSFEPRQRNMKSDAVYDDGEGHIYPGELFGLVVVRDEWKLSVLVGVAILVARNSAFVVGLVPELTLAAKLWRSECSLVCVPGSLSRFDQTFAVYLTVGFEFDVREEADEAAAP